MATPTEETAHALLMRALDGDRDALQHILDKLEAQTGRDGLTVLREILEG